MTFKKKMFAFILYLLSPLGMWMRSGLNTGLICITIFICQSQNDKIAFLFSLLLIFFNKIYMFLNGGDGGGGGGWGVILSYYSCSCKAKQENLSHTFSKKGYF